ncbi:MAG: hypothetical protein ACR2IE_03505 [Candidatus Sumerlaeaceae bacterium]
MTNNAAAPKGILCLSHLAWETTLFQRPQQLMQQFAGRGYRVSYVGCVGLRRKRQLAQSGSIPNLKWTHSGYSAQPGKLAAVRQRVAVYEMKQLLPDPVPIVWLYHPSLLSLVQSLPRKLLVYDVMDRFDAFAAGAESAAADERILLEQADVIFTGGASLQTAIEQKISGLPRTGVAPACFASGLDFSHFAAAASEAMSTAADIATLPRPIFGYFGAVDERIDYELLSRLAQTGGSVVLVGPQITPAPDALPANVHLLGPRPYSELPSYLHGFDVCLLPFCQSPLVDHISPTKTPEYLAGGKPVVSMMIPDVATAYGDVVKIANSAEEFVNACRAAATEVANIQHLQSAAKRARTWEQIAEQMDSVLQQRLT